MAGLGGPFSDKSVAGVPISDESDGSDNSDESDAVMEHPIGCHSASCKFAGSPGEFIEPAKIKQKKLNSNA